MAGWVVVGKVNRMISVIVMLFSIIYTYGESTKNELLESE